MSARVAALALGIAGCAAAPVPMVEARRSLPTGVEAISLLGDTLRAPSLAPATRQRYEQQLADARSAFERAPDDAEAIIWLGRRTAYLGRFREAIDVFTRGIAQHPRDARLYRHRGHRWITVRDFDRAIADFERAAELIAGTPDQVEPDGQPNARAAPIGTLHSNVWYHLGIAHYLKGDFASAARAWEAGQRVSTNPDRYVSNGHWLYTTLRRLGRDAEAARVLASVRRDMEIVENTSYHRLMLLYQGALPVDSLLAPGAPIGSASDASLAYGVGAWHLQHGRRAEAERIFGALVASGQWGAFGVIAAEAELKRFSVQRGR